MKTKIIALLFLTPTLSSADCLEKMRATLGVSQEVLTYHMIRCAVKMMEGERIWLNDGTGWRALRRKLYPETNGELKGQADRLAEYMSCQEFAAAKALYMKKCEKENM